MSEQANTIAGRLVEYADARWGNRLVIQREPANDYEADHADKLLIPFTVPPFVGKKIAVPPTGKWVLVSYRLLGHQYQGKYYLDAQVVDMREQVEKDEPKSVKPADAPSEPPAEDPIPF